MRVLTEFPIGKTAKATIFAWNGKFILKIEKGGLEQTYKVSELDISGFSELQRIAQTSDFQEKVQEVFEKMEAIADTLAD